MTLEIVTNLHARLRLRHELEKCRSASFPFDTESEMFNVGEELDIDICDGLNPPDSREIQLADGSVSFVTPDFWQDVEVVSGLHWPPPTEPDNE